MKGHFVVFLFIIKLSFVDVLGWLIITKHKRLFQEHIMQCLFCSSLEMDHYATKINYWSSLFS